MFHIQNISKEERGKAGKIAYCDAIESTSTRDAINGRHHKRQMESTTQKLCEEAILQAK